MEENFNKRVAIGSDEYDYEGTDQYGKVYLANIRTKEQLIIPQTEFERYKAACLKYFHENLNKDIAMID